MKVIIFDTETTGLIKHSLTALKDQPCIIELGTILWDTKTGRSVERDWLINPGITLDAVITKITGLTDADLQGEPRFAAYVTAIAKVFAQADLALAHNFEFDYGMITNECARIAYHPFPWPPARMCTVRQYEPQFGHRPTLQQLYQHALGVPLAQTHRALDDCRALLAICQSQHRLLFPTQEVLC